MKRSSLRYLPGDFLFIKFSLSRRCQLRAVLDAARTPSDRGKELGWPEKQFNVWPQVPFRRRCRWARLDIWRPSDYLLPGEPVPDRTFASLPSRLLTATSSFWWRLVCWEGKGNGDEKVGQSSVSGPHFPSPFLSVDITSDQEHSPEHVSLPFLGCAWS